MIFGRKVGRKTVLLLFILSASALAGAVYWDFYIKKPIPQEEAEEKPGLGYDILQPPAQSAATSSQQTQAKTTQGFQLYRSEEWGFEFEYPKEWTFETNSFYSPFSKFNLQGNSSANDYNPYLPPFLLNVVTPDFAERAVINIRGLGAIESGIVINGIRGKRLEYKEQHGSYKVSNIAVVLPLDAYTIILGAHKEHESSFNQILSSFKFLK